MTIDDNAQQNSDVKKNGIKCIIANGRYIRDSPSSALQIIVLIIEITIGRIKDKEGMQPNDFMEVLTSCMSFKECTL